MSTPFFLAQRNMRTRWGRTLLTLLGIVLGVAVVLAIQMTNQSTLDSIRQVFDQATGQASLVVVPANRGADKLEEDTLFRAEKFQGVLAAAPSVRVQTLLASEAKSWQIAFSINGIAAGNLLVLYGVDPDLDTQVRVYKLAAGRMPLSDEYEAVLPEKYATEKKLAIGDELEILTPSGRDSLEIVGLLADEGVALLNDGVVTFAPIQVVQDLFAMGSGMDEIGLRLENAISEDPAALESFKDRLNERLGRDAEVIYPAGRGQLVSQMMATYQLGLSFFSVIAVFVGAFLIYNTFSMTIVERTREIGMLRSIGMPRRGIIQMVLAEAILLSSVGSLLGIGAGIVLARGLMQLVSEVIIPVENLARVPLEGLVQSLGVGVGVTLGAALIPATQAARISPLAALRVRTRSIERVRAAVWISGLALLIVGRITLYHITWPTEIRFTVGSTSILLILLGATLTVALASGWLERLARPLATVLYGREGALGSANVRRSVSRTALTVASLMVALTMIISINSLAYSFKEDMTAWIVNALGGDLYVRSPIVMRESFGRQLASVDGVQVVTPTRIILVRAAQRSVPEDQSVGDTIVLNAIEPSTFRQISDMEFAAGQGNTQANWQRLEQGDAVFISNVVADRYQLDQGDTLYLLTRRGEKGFYIAGIVMDFTGQGLVIYSTYLVLQRWFGETGADRFTIKTAQGNSVAVVAEEIEGRYQKRRNISVQTTEEFKDNILNLMDRSFRLFDVLNLIGVIIGALGVINTLTMNVMERQREIGGLRSLGMTRRQVLRMVLAEAQALGIMGGIYGLGFGYAIAHVLILGTNLMIGYDLVFLFTAQPYIIGALIALVIVQMAAIYPARRAAHINIVEAIKHE
ncbi:MAG TPA: FtsX-like permease family protein [Anaerolineales bacterium]